jgi:WD40 repeat protein
MHRVLCRFVLCGLFLAPASWARGQDEQPGPVEADPTADSRVHLVREPGGHAAVPRVLLFTPDGKKLISAGDDQTVQVWDVESRERVRVIRPPTGLDGLGSVPEYLVVDRKGERVAFQVEARHDANDGAGQGPGRMRARPGAPPEPKHGPSRKVRTTFVCSLETGRAQALKRGGPMAFARDGKALAVGEGPEVHLVEIDTDKVLQTATLKHPVQSLAFSPDGKTLAVVNEEGIVHLFDAVTLRPRNEAGTTKKGNKGAGGEHKLLSVGWADDRTLVCRSAQREKELVVLDAGTGEPRRPPVPQKVLLEQLPKGTNATLLDLHAIPRTSKVLVLMANKKPGRERDDWTNVSFLFDWRSHEASHVFLVESPYGCAAAAAAPDLTRAAQGDGNLNDIVLWDTSDGKEVDRLRAAARGAAGGPESVRWRPDGNAVAWQYVGDRASRGGAELDLTTLDFRTRTPEDLKTYQRGIVRDWGSLLLGAKNQALEVTGGPRNVLCPVGAGGAVDWDYTFVAGGRVAADAWNSPVLQVLDSTTGKKLYASRVVHSYIQSLAVSPRPECRYVLLGSADQTLTVYNPATGKVLLTVFPTGADWIAWTPEGYYAATPGGEKLMGWHVNNGPDRLATFYPAERFRKVFYRPDVIKLLLEKGSVKDALAAANDARKQGGEAVGEGPADLEQLLPPRAALEILDWTALPKVKVRATAEAAAEGQPVVLLRLLVDGRPLPDGQGVLDFKPAREKADAEWEVELPPGEHELKALARSPDTAGASAGIPVAAAAAAARPALHVIAVGIDDYAQKALQLKCAVADARGLADAFAKDCVGKGNLFGDVHPTTLLDEKAKRDAVLAALKDAHKAVKSGDLLVFSFAGHGAKLGPKFYLLTHDADPNQLAQTALSGDDLRAALADMPCQVLLLLDACHSAAGVRAFIDEAARGLTDDECGVAVLCAAMGSEEAQEKDGHGLFTRAVMEALGRADRVPYNYRDGRQYVHHLGSFVLDEVKDRSHDEQHPFLTMPYVTESFPIRLLPQSSAGGR